jgi:hypothetical protein
MPFLETSKIFMESSKEPTSIAAKVLTAMHTPLPLFLQAF